MNMKYLRSFTFALCLLLAACGDDNESFTETRYIGDFSFSWLPDEMKTKDTVFIFAPKNCPRAAGQRADNLERELKSQGLTVIRKNSFRFSSTNPSKQEIKEMKKTMEIMKGEVPVVFINEYGKANPSVDEVIDVYDETQ